MRLLIGTNSVLLRHWHVAIGVCVAHAMVQAAIDVIADVGYTSDPFAGPAPMLRQIAPALTSFRLLFLFSIFASGSFASTFRSRAQRSKTRF